MQAHAPCIEYFVHQFGPAIVRSVEHDAADLLLTRQLFLDHASGIKNLGVDINDFQAFDDELSCLPGKYIACKRGALWLASIGSSCEAVACVALRCHEWPRAAEIKRLYVRPSVRGSGLGRVLSLHAMLHAASLGYQNVFLDSLQRQAPAVRLYTGLQFQHIQQYIANPEPDAVFMGWRCSASNVEWARRQLEPLKAAAEKRRRTARLTVLAGLGTFYLIFVFKSFHQII